MIIIDSALEKRHSDGQPIRVGMVGAGFMARGITLQIQQSVPGMELVAISNRTLEGARRAYEEAGQKKITVVDSVKQLETAIENQSHAITEDAELLCKAGMIDAIIEVTGSVEFGAKIVSCAIDNGKHVILMNAELDGTIGPILHQRALKAGVIFTNTDGDQPGVMMNLYRFVKSIGVKPVLCGNIKGLHDPYRNPTTQEAFARQWKQKAHMVTSFADGTKISFEQAIVANATGMRVAKRGMFGPTVESGTPIQQATKLFPEKELLAGNGIVDYVVGAEPGPGVFVLGTHDNPTQRHYLNLYKLGEGPLYCFHTPYHLCHFEVPMTVARAVLFNDATISPTHGPLVEVVATAKIGLKAGEILDGMGYYMTYGLAENAELANAQNLLPIGVAEGCQLKHDIAKDQVLTYADVELPPNRLCDALRAEQNQLFFPK
ncbi:MAG: Gfo/Idh/MocA family oxidoreductase [Pseudomonadales bacterium]|nr:Gfo/Idh/MocA family oxidoreductase [Pseudomonadales bacterium]